MSSAQQSVRLVRKTQQAMSLVADVEAEWLSEPPAPRRINPVAGRIRVPADGPLISYGSAPAQPLATRRGL
jgi:hypothetical protein